MNRILELELRQSEARQELADLLEKEPDSEKIGELNVEMRSLDRQLMAQKLVSPEPETKTVTGTPEGRELRQLVSRSNVGEIFDAALERRSIDGATRELQEHYHLAPNQVPLHLLGGQMETRAVTPAPGDVGQDQQTIVGYMFPMSAASFLGIAMPTVPVGEAVYPVLTSELSVKTPAENAEADETTGAFSADVLSPSRIQAAFFYSREDRARFMGMDEALRQNLTEGLSDGLDDAIITNLHTGTNLPNNPQTTNDDFDSYLSNLVWNQIDGRYASMTGDLAMVVGAATYKDLGATYRNTSVDRSALDRIMELTSGVRVSAHVPAPTNNRQNVIIRRGMSMTAVAPVWEGITIIPDEVTKAKAGQIVITAVMLYAVKVLRTAGGLVKQGTDHS